MNRIKTITPRSPGNNSSLGEENSEGNQSNLQNNNKNKDFNVKFTFSSNKSESTSSKRKRLIKDLASNILELNILRTKAEQLENEIKTMSMDRFDSNVAEVNK